MDTPGEEIDLDSHEEQANEDEEGPSPPPPEPEDDNNESSNGGTGEPANKEENVDGGVYSAGVVANPEQVGGKPENAKPKPIGDEV